MKYKIYLLIGILMLSISVLAEGEATIKNLKVNGTLCTCSGYDCTVEVDASSATITYELADEKATVDRLSGFKIDLLSQTTTVKIVVTNSEGEEKIENTYNIDITKHEKNNDNTLKSLKVNGDKIEITKEVLVYSYTSEFDAEKITIEAETNDSKAKIVNEKEYAFDLKESSLAIDFDVIAENGDKQTYRVVLTRGVKPNTTLKSLTVEPGNINFNKNTYEYDLIVEYNVTDLKVTATPDDKNAKVEVVNETLVVGENKIKITVTSGKAKSEYIINVTREENVDKSIANLKSLKIDEYSKLDFEENVLDYTLSFKKIPEKLNIKAIAKDEKAVVTILDNEDLKENSIVTIKVTLDEPSVSREYSLKLVKVEKEEEEENKQIILISIIGLVITIIILLILEIHSKKKAKRNYLKKIFELRHKIERKRKEEKNKKETIDEEEIEII